MAEPDRYAIQRADTRWYGGGLEQGDPRWVTRSREAVNWEDIQDARAALKRLRAKGHRVFLLTI